MQTLKIANEKSLAMLKRMLLIRGFEEAVRLAFANGKLPGFVHVSVGEEAVAVGVCANLRDDDYVTSTHRGHGHCIAKGVDVKMMMAELYGKETGASKGKGGSMHIFDNKLGMLGANGIVGAGSPLATGAALSAKMRKTDQVAVCFFGDGAANQGAVHESMNLAALWKLPVIFAIENNQYAQYTRHDLDTSVKDFAVRGAAYGMPSKIVNGMDVTEVYGAAHEAVQRAREGKGPTLLEFKTYRYYGHGEGDPQVYRTKEEVEEYRKLDPIQSFRSRLIGDGVLTEQSYAALEAEIDRQVEDAVKFAEESPLPAPSEYLDDVYVSYP
jgi:acetoin:2,6-dichlorophenolindophenol oxidoreductase subunit alpha